MRALIRRIQNRGYATLRRIAEHLDSLSAGDESNATLEAVDAVNLMTVHAAKGLEFPVVFVVNLAKGAGGALPPIRVSADTPDRPPSVSVASYISEADEDHKARELEESKRLLYVALTRARDSLYLATVLKDGEMRPGRGSLGEVLPDPVRALFAPVAAGACLQHWTGPSGAVHAIRRVSPPGDEMSMALSNAVIPARAPDAFAPLAVSGDLPRIAATACAADRVPTGPRTAAPFASADDLIVGTLVHRLFQRSLANVSPDLIPDRARRLLRPEERAQLQDEAAALAQAATLFCAIRAREDVTAVISSGTCHYEVPFSLRVDGPAPAVLRGTIDCLVRRADGSVFVLEFKTGRHRAEHDEQLGIYLAAARAMFPDAPVEGTVIYP